MSDLESHIFNLVKAKQSIGFDEYMELALYGPVGGYYMGGGTPADDFRTAPETHPLFAAMLTRRLDRAWRQLGRPDPFEVVELGCGPGVLASQVFKFASHHVWGPSLRWVGVEVGPGRRRAAQLRCPRGRFTGGIGSIESAPARVVIGNEFLDALPFRIARRHGDSWCELRVVAGEGNRLELAESPADTELADYGRKWALGVPDGGTFEVCSRLRQLFGEIARLADSLLVIFIDYGGSAEQVHSTRFGSGTSLGYRQMDVVTDLLASPGQIDLTAHVNFDAVDTTAASFGFRSRAIANQAEYLIELGIGQYLPGLIDQQNVNREILNQERDAVLRLLDPRDMGSFKVFEAAR